jgi:hypothetical protein
MAPLNRILFMARFLARGCGLVQAVIFVVLPPLAYSLEEPTTLSSAMSQVSGERMLADVARLSSAEFNGRQAGTEDDLRSAHWVSDRMQSSGLILADVRQDRLDIPGPGDGKTRTTGFMTTLITTSIIEANPALRISAGGVAVTRRLGTDYLPVFDSPTADLQGPIVFVGYGIVDPAHRIDDYAGVDVQNSIVLFLRGKPDHYHSQISHAEKVRLARQKGALGYLTATGPVLNAYETRRGMTGTPTAFYGSAGVSEPLPGAWISTGLAEEILAGTAPSQTGQLRARQEQLNKAPDSQSVRTERFGRLSWKTRPVEGILTNVLGVIPGSNPETAQEAIVIGAHRDHFGKQAGLLFPGADDNASGTAVMLEVARALAKLLVKPTRTLLFLSFSGEERGLLGSRLYVGRPIIPLANTKAMINIDHAGIGNGRLTVGMTELDKRLAQEAGHSAGLADKLDLFGFFPGGDHVPFKEAGIPTVTVVSGGTHPHFHQATDTVETINREILVSAARYVLALTWQLANAP